jgi:hypothetical protein
MSGGFHRRLDRVEQQLQGLRSADGVALRPDHETAGRQIAAAFLDGAPPPPWLTDAEWQRLAGHMRHFEAVYDEFAANAVRFDGQPRHEAHDDEPSPPDEGGYNDEAF